MLIGCGAVAANDDRLLFTFLGEPAQDVAQLLGGVFPLVDEEPPLGINVHHHLIGIDPTGIGILRLGKRDPDLQLDLVEDRQRQEEEKQVEDDVDKGRDLER